MPNEEEVTDPKDQETSDWSIVERLESNTKVKPYSVETLATNKVPHNIPYLEVYRTDELYYVPYTSPYLSTSADGSISGGDGSGSEGSGNGTGGGELWTELSKIVWDFYPASKDKNYWIQELRDAKNDWTSVAQVVNKMGGDKDKQNKVIRKVLDAKKKFPYDSTSSKVNYNASIVGKGIVDSVYTAKDRNTKLKKELKKAITPYFKKNAPLDKIAKRYMQVANTRVTVSSATAKYEKYLKNGNSSELTDKVLSIKKKYTG